MDKETADGSIHVQFSAATYMDLHICGACKAQFNNVEIFIAHKQHNCPILIQMRPMSLEQISSLQEGAENQGIIQTLVATSSIESSQGSSMEHSLDGGTSGVKVEERHSSGHSLITHVLSANAEQPNPVDHAVMQSGAEVIEQRIFEQADIHAETNQLQETHRYVQGARMSQIVEEEHGIAESQNTSQLHHSVKGEEHHEGNSLEKVVLKSISPQSANEMATLHQHNQREIIMHQHDQREIATLHQQQREINAMHQQGDITPLHQDQQEISTMHHQKQRKMTAIHQQDQREITPTSIVQQFLADQVMTEPLDNLATIASGTLPTGLPSISQNLSLLQSENQQTMNITSSDDSPVTSTMGFHQNVNLAAAQPVTSNQYVTVVQDLTKTQSVTTTNPTVAGCVSFNSHTSEVIQEDRTAEADSTQDLTVQETLQSVLNTSNLASAGSPNKQGLQISVGKMIKTRQPLTKKYKCTFDFCNFSTAYLKDLERHTRTHTGERPFQCHICNKCFNRSDKLKIHLRGHTGNKPYKCQFCAYSSADSSSLKKHLRIHTDERPFKCQICPYASRNSSQLIVHLRTHTGDSPFQCQLCDAKFKINSDLKRHMRIHTGEKPYKCDLCDYRCSIKANLKSHYRINHSTENQLQCGACHFATSSRKAFKEHIKIHDTDRPIKCPACMYQCSRRSALRNHLRTHSEEKPFSCEFCSYTSKQSGNVKTHMKKKHTDKLRQKRKAVVRKTSEVEKDSNLSEDEPNSSRIRIKPNCRKTYKCDVCSASFVREDSLRSHTRQHRDVTQALESTALAVLQLQNPTTAVISQQAATATMGGTICPTVSISGTVAQTVVVNSSVHSASNPALPGAGLSSTPVVSAQVQKNLKESSSFPQTFFNLGGLNSAVISQDAAMLGGVAQPLPSMTLPQNITLSSVPLNSPGLSLNAGGNLGSGVFQNSISQPKGNCVSAPSGMTHNMLLSQGDMGQSIMSAGQCSSPGFSLPSGQTSSFITLSQVPLTISNSSPLSTMATTAQTNVSQVLPSVVASPVVSTGTRRVVNGSVLNNQPVQQQNLVAPQLVQTPSGLQLISNLQLPLIRMPNSQMGAQNQILSSQLLGQRSEPISIMSTPVASLEPQSPQQATEIPMNLQIISQRTQQSSTIPINVQISQINIEAPNQVLETSNSAIPAVQVILPSNIHQSVQLPITSCNTNSNQPGIVVQVSAPSSLNSGLSSRRPTAPLSSLPVNLIPVISQTAANALCQATDDAAEEIEEVVLTEEAGMIAQNVESR